MATPSNRLAETSMVSGRDSATLQQRRDNFLNAQRRIDQKPRLKNKPPDDGLPRPALLQRRVQPPRAAAREHRGRGATAAAAPPQTSAEAPAAVNAITDLPAPVPERTEVETKAITDLRAEVASLHAALIALGKNVVNQAQTITDQAQIMRGRLPSEANSSPPLVPLRRLPDGGGCELDFLDPAEPAVELEAEPTAGPKAKQWKKHKKKSGSKRA